MNFSMQDTFNLGWKLAAVLRGQCAPALAAHAIRSERQVVAQELIDFDREWAKMFSDRARQAARRRQPRAWTRRSSRSTSSSTARFTAGMGTHYRPSRHHAAKPRTSTWPRGFVIGTRFHSAPVVRITDARPVHLGHAGKADGRWRLYAFAGATIADDAGGCRARCAGSWRNRPIRRCAGTRAPGQDIDAVFDLRAIFQQPHRELAIEAHAGPAAAAQGPLRPARLREGLLRRT